jgi:hypothetical protein
MTRGLTVGTKVVVLDGLTGKMKKYAGKVCKVVERDDELNFPYKVKFPSRVTVAFLREELRRVNTKR